MEGIVHLILLLSGLCFLSSCTPQHQYILVRTPKTWYEAQSYCRQQCFDLATLDDMGEMETVLKAVEDQYDYAVWIGLWKGMTLSWYWSLADDTFYKEGERKYLIWGAETPNNCGSFINKKLYSIPCVQLLYSVCFDAEETGKAQYVLTPQKLNWTAAQDYCRTYYTDLSSVRNDVENQLIKEIAGGMQVWIGLFRDPWVWSDQTYSSLRYWPAYQAVLTQPGEKCVGLLKSEFGRWGQLTCKEAHPFLCNCPIVRFIQMRISSKDSVLEQREPAVQDDILKQITQQLRNTNLTDAVKLQWKKHPDGRVFIKEPH